MLLVLALAASLGFDVLSLDADQADLQSIGNICRSIYLRTNAIHLEKVDCIKTLRPVCSLVVPGGIWARTLVHHHLEGLGMTRGATDFAFLWRGIGNHLLGLSATYVDELLQQGQRKNVGALFIKVATG